MGLQTVLDAALGKTCCSASPSSSTTTTSVFLHKRLKLRILAWTNICGLTYFITMVITVVSLGITEVLPTVVSSETPRSYHLMFIVYLFLNVFGNCYNVYSTDTSASVGIKHARKSKRQPSFMHKFNKSRNVDLATASFKEKGLAPTQATGDNINCLFTKFVCETCRITIPKRCHHCSLCNVCILKRDHHCFFLCSCIGYHNQKYFTMFCWWMSVSALYICYMGTSYFNLVFHTSFSFPAVPLTLLPTILTRGAQSGYQMTLVGLFYGCFGCGVASAVFFVSQVRMALLDKTKHEMRYTREYYSTNYWVNFKDVFGPYWYLTLIFPVSIPQVGSGLYGYEFVRKQVSHHKVKFSSVS